MLATRRVAAQERNSATCKIGGVLPYWQVNEYENDTSFCNAWPFRRRGRVGAAALNRGRRLADRLMAGQEPDEVTPLKRGALHTRA